MKERVINKGSGTCEFQAEVGLNGTNSSRVSVAQHTEKGMLCWFKRKSNSAAEEAQAVSIMSADTNKVRKRLRFCSAGGSD